MKRMIAFVAISLLASSAVYAQWSSDRMITSVQVADACGTVAGQYAVITDNAGGAYWITSNADNFNSVVDMAQRALIHDRTVTFYSRPENYTVQTLRSEGGCHTGGTLTNRLSILNIK